jgi:hypothetical protein
MSINRFTPRPMTDISKIEMVERMCHHCGRKYRAYKFSYQQYCAMTCYDGRRPTDDWIKRRK